MPLAFWVDLKSLLFLLFNSNRVVHIICFVFLPALFYLALVALVGCLRSSPPTVVALSICNYYCDSTQTKKKKKNLYKIPMRDVSIIRHLETKRKIKLLLPHAESGTLKHNSSTKRKYHVLDDSVLSVFDVPFLERLLLMSRIRSALFYDKCDANSYRHTLYGVMCSASLWHRQWERNQNKRQNECTITHRYTHLLSINQMYY